MSVKKILREYKKSAAAAGKPIEIVPVRNGFRIQCGDRSIKISHKSQPTANHKAIRNRLGL